MRKTTGQGAVSNTNEQLLIGPSLQSIRNPLSDIQHIQDINKRRALPCQPTQTVMFRDTAKPKNQMDEFLGPISPLMQAKPAHTGDHGSVSFAGGKDEAGSEMSIDSSNASTTQRAPLGEVQVGWFWWLMTTPLLP
jgi:hypothetical protein